MLNEKCHSRHNGALFFFFFLLLWTLTP